MAPAQDAGKSIDRITGHLGDEAADLLSYTVKGIPKERLMVPSGDHVGRAWGASDRKPPVLVNLQRLYGTGRLANTGYLSILPVDQGVEHSAAASFAPNPDYVDPEKIVELAIEAECNAVASTMGVLGSVARKFAHK
ncbi:MAG TPA: fructose-bisphosphate aldolase, partial [Thermoanaerobaculia bacterium]